MIVHLWEVKRKQEKHGCGPWPPCPGIMQTTWNNVDLGRRC